MVTVWQAQADKTTPYTPASWGHSSGVMVSLSNHDRAVDDVALRQAQGDKEVARGDKSLRLMNIE